MYICNTYGAQYSVLLHIHTTVRSSTEYSMYIKISTTPLCKPNHHPQACLNHHLQPLNNKESNKTPHLFPHSLPPHISHYSTPSSSHPKSQRHIPQYRNPGDYSFIHPTSATGCRYVPHEQKQNRNTEQVCAYQK